MNASYIIDSVLTCDRLLGILGNRATLRVRPVYIDRRGVGIRAR